MMRFAHSFDAANCFTENDSFGECMRSSGCPQPTSNGAAHVASRNAATTGIDAPFQRNAAPRLSICERMSCARLNIGDVSARRKAEESPLSSGKDTTMPSGHLALRCSLIASNVRKGFCPGTSRVESFAIAWQGITVLEPGPP